MNKQTLLQIIVTTYNHELYIRRTLESFVEQKTNFNFEVLINDDCSTDGTTEIIKEYEKKYPDIIKPIYQKKNLYSQGIEILRDIILPRITAKYVIINDGDDYFCDDTKLQQQVDFLESHPEYIGCFHPVKMIFEDDPNRVEYISTKSQIGGDTVTLEKELKENCIATNSVMYRWQFKGDDIKNYIPDNILPGDWYIHLLHLTKGNVFHFTDTPMSVYRINKGSIWGSMIDNQDLINIKHGIKQINFFFHVYNNITNKSADYKENMLEPKIKTIIKSNFKHEKWKELVNIFDKFGSQIAEFSSIEPKTDEIACLKQKYKKYKKLYKLLLPICIILFALLIAALIYICRF